MNRLNCRFGKHFEYPLLIQSIVMNIAMFAMIHLCVHVRNANQLLQARQKIFTGTFTTFCNIFFRLFFSYCYLLLLYRLFTYINIVIRIHVYIFLAAKPSEVIRLLQSKPPSSSHSICGKTACTIRFDFL